MVNADGLVVVGDTASIAAELTTNERVAVRFAAR